jgi:hypothetical protein
MPSVTELAAENPNLQEYLTQVEQQRDDAQMRVAELEARPLAFADAKVIDERDAAIARAEKGEKYFQEMAEQISTLCRDRNCSRNDALKANSRVAQLTQEREAALHAQDHFQEVARLAQEERAQAINMNNVLTKERDDARHFMDCFHETARLAREERDRAVFQMTGEREANIKIKANLSDTITRLTGELETALRELERARRPLMMVDAGKIVPVPTSFPHKCPVCEGRGIIKGPGGDNNDPLPCPVCDGACVIWSKP